MTCRATNRFTPPSPPSSPLRRPASRSAGPRSPLTHGAFLCPPGHAAEGAHVLAAAEDAYGIDARAALEELGRYLDGSASADETIAELEMLALEGGDG